MPSRALQDLEARLEEIEQLLSAHGALTRFQRAEAAARAAAPQSLQAIAQVVNRLVTPPGPGRPREVQALNKAAIALLSAHLQGYVEDLFEETARLLLDGKVPDVQALIDQARLRGNPTWDNITRLFGAAGFTDILAGISWQRCNHATVKARLRGLNELRNRIVHGGAEAVRKRQVQNFRGFVQNFTAKVDQKVAREFHRLVGRDPW
jgi:RiboL-PSP-HEPN